MKERNGMADEKNNRKANNLPFAKEQKKNLIKILIKKRRIKIKLLPTFLYIVRFLFFERESS